VDLWLAGYLQWPLTPVPTCVQRLLSPYQIELHAGRPEEVTAEVIIEHIKKIIVSDGDFSDKADMDMYSMENFYSALAEEDAAAQEFFQDEVVH
jgi:hypothetical protein